MNLAPRPGLEPGTYGLTVVGWLILRDGLRRVGIVDISCQSKGYAISLSRLIPKSTMSAIDFSDICRTPDAPLDRACGFEAFRSKAEPYKITLDRGLQLDRTRRQADAARTLYGQGLEHRAPISPARRAGRFRPATPLVASAQDPLLVLPAVGRKSRIRKHGNCAPCAARQRNRGPYRTRRLPPGPRRDPQA